MYLSMDNKSIGISYLELKIFQKNDWTDDEIKEIYTYLFKDIEITRRLFEFYVEYFDIFKMMLGNKYDIVIDNNVPRDEIVVYNDGRQRYFSPHDEELEKIQKEKEKKVHYVLIKVLNFNLY